jgi:hypothetical protein
MKGKKAVVLASFAKLAKLRSQSDRSRAAVYRERKKPPTDRPADVTHMRWPRSVLVHLIGGVCSRSDDEV